MLHLQKIALNLCSCKFKYIPLKTQQSTSFSDYLGITSALICLLHCLAAPVLMGWGVLAHSHGENFWLDHSWDYVFLGLGLIAVWFSSEHTHQKFLKVLLWITFGLLCGTVFLGHSYPVFQVLAFAASLGLIFAHLLNLKETLKRRVVSRAS